MDYFPKAFSIVVGLEGGFSTDRQDPGNWTSGHIGQGEFKGTKYGVSAAAYPLLDIANLSLVDAQAIYVRDYWEFSGCQNLPWSKALMVFDAAVNQGQNWARGLTGDVVEMFAARAVRYMHEPGFVRDGHGWMRRLANILIQGQKPL